MSAYDDLPLSITGTITFQKDFAFRRNVGELANRLRTKLLSSEQIHDFSLMSMNIDQDGDINIRTSKGAAYITSSMIHLVGWVGSHKDLLQGKHLREIPKVLESLYEERSSLVQESFSVRMLFIARFTGKQGLAMLKTRSADAVLGIVLGGHTPPEIESFRMMADYERGLFSDSLEIEGSLKDVQIRYARTGGASQFSSYTGFLDAAKLGELSEQLRGFAEPFVAEPKVQAG